MEKPNALFQRADHSIEGDDNSNIVLLWPGLFAIQAMEGLAIQEAEVDILWDIWWRSQDGHHGDIVAQATMALKSESTTGAKSVLADEWALQDGLLTFQDRIYVPNILELH
ncbi:hypothetical protein C0993_006420 [Termitomyces sp. T159_Od127]|nr:hypothetical protein C0993_006420 [Termitomyces sp. T159_Od127]